MQIQSKETRELHPARLLIIFILFFVANLYSVFQRSALAVISAELTAEFSLTPSQLGTLSSGFLYSYAVMQIVSGGLSARIGVRSLIVASLVSAGALSCFFVTLKAAVPLVVFRALIGVACSFIYVPALNEIRRLAPVGWAAVLTGGLLSAGHVGSLLAAAPLSALCAAFGWRTALFWLTGILPLLAGLFAWLLLPARPNDKKNAAMSADVLPGKTRGGFRQLLQPGIIALLMWPVLAGSPRHAFASVWIAQFYTNALGYSRDEMSNMAFCLSLGCIVGGPVCGRVANRFGVMKTLLVTTAAAGLSWLTLVPAGLFLSSAAVQAALMLMTGVLGTGAFTCAFAAVSYYNLPQASGLVVALINSFNFFASAVISQIIGSASERFAAADAVSLYRCIFASFCFMGLLSVLTLFLTNRKLLAKP